jgi:DNA-binding XRE family transcriptional regulator
MTTMDRFLHLLQERVPEAKLELDRPEQGGGTWWLDVSSGKRALTVEWTPSMGFGVSSLPSEGFGEGPDEFFDDEAQALARVEHLLRTGEHTRPPAEMALKRLREACHVSQTELATRMKMTQGAVSKLERNADPSVALLREWVRALGGDLEILATFKRGSVKVDV